MKTLTKSELMQAAHKIAKAIKVKMNGGDYLVYLQFALKSIHKKSQLDARTVKAGINKLLKSTGLDCFFFETKKVSATHGLIEVNAEYELNKVELKKGQFFGESFTKNGKVCAWVRSFKHTQVAI